MYISLLHPLNAPDHRMCVYARARARLCLRVCAWVAVVDGHQRSLQLISETNYNYKQWLSLKVAKASPFKKRGNKHIKSSFWFKHNPNDIIQKYRYLGAHLKIFILCDVSLGGGQTRTSFRETDVCFVCEASSRNIIYSVAKPIKI